MSNYLPVYSVVGGDVQINGMYSDSTNAVVKDYGIDYFGDFEIDIESQFDYAETGTINLPFIMSNSNPPTYHDAHAIYVGWKATDTNVTQLFLGRDNATSEDYTTVALTAGVLYYLNIKRTAATNNITTQIYSKKPRTPTYLIDTLSISYTSTAFRYIGIGAAGVSSDTTDPARFWGTNKRLNLNQNLYYLRQISTRYRRDNGDEVTATWKEAENTFITSESNINTRIRIGIAAVPFAAATSYFDQGLDEWDTIGNGAITGGYLSAYISGSVTGGQDAAYKKIPASSEYFCDFDYTWGVSGWTPGTSNYVMINALANDPDYVASFAINTISGKVGVMFKDNTGMYGEWSDISEGDYGNNDFSRVKLYYKRATSGANGIIQMWYNDTLTVNLNNVNNTNVGDINIISVGNSYTDGTMTGDLIVHKLKTYKPLPGGSSTTIGGNLRLEYRKTTDTEWRTVSLEGEHGILSPSSSKSPSASVSPSHSMSPSKSPSASKSPSSSISPSSSQSNSPSSSQSPSASMSPSRSRSPSISPSSSQSPSASTSLSVSLSISPSASVSPSASASPSPG